jgi:ABC-type nickel/cobalt efflux system permease component RcnA
VNAAQRQLNQALSRELRRLRQGEVAGPAFAVAWIAFLYGVLHAIGPGHGKLVISSLFLAREARLGTAVAVSGAVSLLQTVSAVVIVSIVTLALGRSGFEVFRDSRRIELVSYGLITVIGLVMLLAAIRELWGRRHGDVIPSGGAPAEGGPPGGQPGGQPGGRVSSGLVLATGLTPCASAVIILLFALGQGVFLVGIAASLVMAVGMGLTVSLVGILAVLTRRGTVRAASSSRGIAPWVKGLLGVLGAAAIACLGLVLFLGAWTGA